MAVIVVSGGASGAGATTVAVGLAHRLAYAGKRVQLGRLGSDPRARADAATFAALEFATAAAEPLEAAPTAPAGGVLILEVAPGVDAAGVAAPLGGRVVIVGAEGASTAAEATLIVNHAGRGGPLRLAEDRLLAAPTVGTLIEASRAQVLARSQLGDRELCEYIVIGPVASDEDKAHFDRYPRKAVVTRSEKVDIALAALASDTRCLILSGGHDPSPYLIDRVASDRRTTLLLAPGGTVETVRALEATFGASAFAGEEKVECIGELMAVVLDDATVAALAS